jgi:hypothetical protein
VELVVDNVTLGQVFSEYYGFLYQFPFHQLLHTHHPSSEAGAIGQLMFGIPSGLSRPIPRKLKKKKKESGNGLYEVSSQLRGAAEAENEKHLRQNGRYPKRKAIIRRSLTLPDVESVVLHRAQSDINVTILFNKTAYANMHTTSTRGTPKALASSNISIHTALSESPACNDFPPQKLR